MRGELERDLAPSKLRGQVALNSGSIRAMARYEVPAARKRRTRGPSCHGTLLISARMSSARWS